MTRRRPKVQSHRLLRYGPNLPKQGVIDWPLDTRRPDSPNDPRSTDNQPADQQPHDNNDDTT